MGCERHGPRASGPSPRIPKHKPTYHIVCSGHWLRIQCGLRGIEEADGPATLHRGPIEQRIGVRCDGMADEIEQREIRDRVGVEVALRQVDPLLFDELLEPVDLSLFEADRLDHAPGEDSVLDLRIGN